MIVLNLSSLGLGRVRARLAGPELERRPIRAEELSSAVDHVEEPPAEPPITAFEAS